MHVVIFEDALWPAFAPFSLSRPVFALASGMTTLLRKQIRHLQPTRLTLWVRPPMRAYCLERMAAETGVPTTINTPLDDESALLINARMLLSKAFERPGQNAACVGGDGTVLFAMTHGAGLDATDVLSNSAAWQTVSQYPAAPSQGRLLESPVDLIDANDQILLADFAYLEQKSSAKPTGPYHLVNDVDVWLGRAVTLSAGCVLDASKGPVVASDGASIGPNAVIQGPCYIGHGSTVTPLAMIRPGTTLGAMCKVGGEVSVSIFLGHSNKAHEGFLGQSYIGKWVNLGAGTTTSNLKNTYGEINLMRGSTEMAKNRRFLGSLIGDHSKTAILTRLVGGTYVGFSSMLAGSGWAPRFVPSFTFWTDRGAERYEHDKAIDVAQRMFTRRDRAWTNTDEQIMSYVADAAPMIES